MQIGIERRFLNTVCEKSELDEDIFFFEVDSMDSSKTLLPHTTRINKKFNSDLLLKVRPYLCVLPIIVGIVWYSNLRPEYDIFLIRAYHEFTNEISSGSPHMRQVQRETA